MGGLLINYNVKMEMSETMIQRLFVVVYLIATIVVLSGCQTSTTHRDGEGPLVVKSAGGFALDTNDMGAPPWYYTSGYFPCVRNSNTKSIEIVNVDYKVNEKVPPLEVNILKREVINGDGDRLSYPELELAGAPLQIDPQNGIPLKGEITKDVKGMKVKQHCDELDINNYSSLLIVAKSNRKGMQIESITIDYLADGKPYTVEVF